MLGKLRKKLREMTVSFAVQPSKGIVIIEPKKDKKDKGKMMMVKNDMPKQPINPIDM